MKDTVKMWKCKLEHEIKETTACKMTPETLRMSEQLAECWLLYDDMCKRLWAHDDMPETSPEVDGPVVAPMYRLSAADIKHWNDNMLNADGTKGGHWTTEQTDGLARSLGVYFEHITNAEWNVTCNMMYSDYHMVAKNMGVDTPEFYGHMAKAFLFDRDGGPPGKKLCAYYHNVAHPKHD